MTADIGYEMGRVETNGKEYPIQGTLNKVLKREYCEERFHCLSEIITNVLHDSYHEYAALCIDHINFGGVKFSTIETMLSYLLFERAVTSCNIAMKDGDIARVIHAFIDLNYAIHYSISKEMLGLCGLYRAFFLPKNENEELTKNAFIQNELNIAEITIDHSSNVYKLFVGGFNIMNRSPDVYYYFFSDDVENKSRYTYVYNICSLANYVPGCSQNPRNYLNAEGEINGNLLGILENPEHTLLANYETNKKIFDIQKSSEL